MSIEKQSYKMTDEQYAEMLTQAAPFGNIYGGGGTPLIDESMHHINDAWKKLGAEMGFRWDTVRPDGKPQYFLAMPIDEAPAV